MPILLPNSERAVETCLLTAGAGLSRFVGLVGVAGRDVHERDHAEARKGLLFNRAQTFLVAAILVELVGRVQ